MLQSREPTLHVPKVRERLKSSRTSAYDIFLDLKFHDIPNTVAKAVAAAVRLPRVRLMTLHASGGLAVMRAAREAAGSKKNRPALLAVTVLTSFDEATLREIGMEGSLGSRAVALARLARTAGMDGVVCSALEARPCDGSLDLSSRFWCREYVRLRLLRMINRGLRRREMRFALGRIIW